MHNTNSQECILKKCDILFLTALYYKFSPLVRLDGTWKPPRFPQAWPMSYSSQELRFPLSSTSPNPIAHRTLSIQPSLTSSSFDLLLESSMQHLKECCLIWPLIDFMWIHLVYPTRLHRSWSMISVSTNASSTVSTVCTYHSTYRYSINTYLPTSLKEKNICKS